MPENKGIYKVPGETAAEYAARVRSPGGMGIHPPGYGEIPTYPGRGFQGDYGIDQFSANQLIGKSEDAVIAMLDGWLEREMITEANAHNLYNYALIDPYIPEAQMPLLTKALEGVTYDSRGEPQLSEATAIEVGNLLSGMRGEISNALQEQGMEYSPELSARLLDIQQAAYEKAGITEQVQGYERRVGTWGVGRAENIARGRITQPEALPQYKSIFGETEVTGTQRWRDWYESKYSSELSRFRATTPIGTAEQKEESWAEFLRKRKPELKEEFYRQPQYQRGLRPSAFAPRIKTVGF